MFKLNGNYVPSNGLRHWEGIVVLTRHTDSAHKVLTL